MQGLPQLAQDIVQAADKGNWKVFTEKMGGVLCMRKEQVFQPYYEFSFDKESGVIKTSQYCDNELIRALKGVSSAGREFITRILEWRIESKLANGF